MIYVGLSHRYVEEIRFSRRFNRAISRANLADIDVSSIKLLSNDRPVLAETATRGLGISDSPTSDNLTPQETTTQDPPDLGPDGLGFSCPGGSVVATTENEKDIEKM